VTADRPEDQRADSRGTIAPAVLAGAAAELGAHVLGVDWLASPLQPALQFAFKAIGEADRRMWHQIAQTLDVAIDDTEGGASELERLALADLPSTELFRRVVAAAGRSTIEDKIPALGRVLANGLGDAGRVDKALFLAAALQEIEAAHVRVLATIAYEDPGPDEIGEPGLGWLDWQLENRFSQDLALLPAVVSALSRHALVRNLALGTWHSSQGQSKWVVSELGTECLDLLGAANDER
jgi:hypothetical protein